MRAILTYHSIDPSGSPISVHPDAFDRHVAWLRSGRVQLTTVERLVDLPADADAVAITFDDGFVNFADVASPRLLDHDCPVTLFVVTDNVGRTNAWHGTIDRSVPHLPLLDWAALARLHERGVTIGAHSATHADLTSLDSNALEHEVRESVDAIERETGSRPRLFAYPYGRHTPPVRDIVSRTFEYACTTEFATLGTAVVPTELPRLDMYYFQRGNRLNDWGTPAFARYVALRQGLRRVRQTLRAGARPHAKL